MSTRIIGFISEDNETYRKHKKVLIACVEAGIQKLPEETAAYFNSSYPTLSLIEEKLELEIPKHKYNGKYSSGFEIFISEIPEGVHKIRFENSW